MSTQAKRNRLRKLHHKNPHCVFCGVCTFLPRDPMPSAPEKYRMATIEHLDSRLSGRRGDFTSKNVERTVLACWKCNNDRAKQEQAEVERAELRRRAQAGHQRLHVIVVRPS